jgi:LysM repeat protein
MKKISFLLPLVAIILGIGLGGCSRAASETTDATPTATLSIPILVNTQMPSMKDILSGTQTALAKTAVNTSTPTPTATSEGTATVTPFPSATPGRPTTYTLQRGEFPYCIARRFDVDVGDLLALNGMTTSSRPSVGTVLKIPTTGSWSAAHGNRYLIAHPATYTVVAGDTIYTIACKYGDVDPNAILSANGLSPGAALTAGQTLQIP